MPRERLGCKKLKNPEPVVFEPEDIEQPDRTTRLVARASEVRRARTISGSFV
jgi:hypothetical protein